MPLSSNLNLAELSLQRGEYQQSRAILEKRINRGASDFKTLNLFGISLAHGYHYDNAATIFQRLQGIGKSKRQKTKAVFNLGLVKFYQDLGLVGDLSVASYRGSRPTLSTGTWGPSVAEPFAKAIATLESLRKGKPPYLDIISTYLAFAYLQTGNLNRAISRLIEALSPHENFYLTHFVLGRIFSDLYHLAVEGNDFGVSRQYIEFFEIEDYEIHKRERGRFAIYKDTLLDIALQAFLESRTLNTSAPVVYMGLCQTYLLAGLYEEAEEALNQAQVLAPDSTQVLAMTLQFHEQIQSDAAVIKTLLSRLKSQTQKMPVHEIYHILPSYYLY